MTNESAMRALQMLRGRKASADFMDDALDIALWLFDWHAAVKAGADMIAWERDNPKPSERT